ncbi:ATP-grasp domain-containing protein, partial [Staphylococcus epidermidis]
LTYPLFLKPPNLPSSLDITKCNNQQQLKSPITEPFQFDPKLLIQQPINPTHIQLPLLPNHYPQTTSPPELLNDVPFYHYKS